MTLPVSLVEAKRQLRVLDDDQDDEIEGFIADAAAWVENHTGHILEERVVIEHFYGRAAATLNAWPIVAEAQPTITYVDTSDVTVTIDAWAIDVRQRPAVISAGSDSLWPFATNSQPYSIAISAGYADPNEVPRNLRRAMLVLIGGYDADREGGETFALAEKTAMSLCRRFKVHTL